MSKATITIDDDPASEAFGTVTANIEASGDDYGSLAHAIADRMTDYLQEVFDEYTTTPEAHKATASTTRH